MIKITGRERLLAALRLQEPDRVPVSPDISSMYPCKMNGRPFWEVLLYNDPPLWQLTIDISRKQGFDLILACSLGAGPDDVPVKSEVIEAGSSYRLVRNSYLTKKGLLTEEINYPEDKSPWRKKPLVEDIEDDYKKVLSMFVDPWKKDTKHFFKVRDYLGEDGIVRAGGITVPTDYWLRQRGSIKEGIMDYYDYPQIMEELTTSYCEYALNLVEANCKLLKPDLLMIGGSLASMSVISPQMYLDYNLPFLQEATAICKKYNVSSGVHMCGKSSEMLDVFTNDTDLSMIEPLESPPGGNVSLKQVKEKYGKKLCLKGNINTYEVLAKGNFQEVEKNAIQCIKDAKDGGGFILSSGDQVAPETPRENLDAMVNASHRQY